jgi:hypothetical protein
MIHKFTFEVVLKTPPGVHVVPYAGEYMEDRLEEVFTVDMLGKLLEDGIPPDAEVGEDCYLQLEMKK